MCGQAGCLVLEAMPAAFHKCFEAPDSPEGPGKVWRLLFRIYRVLMLEGP